MCMEQLLVQLAKMENIVYQDLRIVVCVYRLLIILMLFPLLALPDFAI